MPSTKIFTVSQYPRMEFPVNSVFSPLFVTSNAQAFDRRERHNESTAFITVQCQRVFCSVVNLNARKRLRIFFHVTQWRTQDPFTST